MEQNNIINSQDFPLLSKIDSPDDLRKLDVSQLPQVCSELRKYMIDVLSENPGHFASSMGAVELTVALHYVFNTPYDRIVWDVGHQAYGHKILTGRRDSFPTIRKLNGLSGFPNPEESEYDNFIAGHASNSISAALGMATASNINGDNPRRNVIAVIGDASIAGGLAFEGLNNAAASKSNLLIVLNDNDMSIDHNVGSLNNYLVTMSTSKGYNTFRYRTYKLLKKLHLIDEQHRGVILRFNNSLKSLISKQQNIFEGLNIRYFGPYDGHNLESLVRAFNDIKDMEGPRMIHLRTIKGKGYAPAEKDPCTWHAPGKFNKETGELIKSPDDGRLKYQDVFGKTLVELAEKNPKIAGITAAMPTGCSMTFMQQAFPKRTFDVGISEGHAVTFAGGLAKDGAKPFCCIYSSFLQRGYDEIIHDVALQKLPVTFCIDRAGLVGEDGATHHGVFDLCYLRSIPNMIVAAPIDEHCLRNLMYTSQAGNYGPFAIRYPRGKAPLSLAREAGAAPAEWGKCEVLREGSEICLIGVGSTVPLMLEAADEISKRGAAPTVVDLRFIKPLDIEGLLPVLASHSTVVTAEENALAGGVGEEIAALMKERGIAASCACAGVPDRFIAHATRAQQWEECGLTVENIMKLCGAEK